MVIEEKQKNGAQLFFTSNIENYIIKGELTDEVSPELVELLHYIEHTTQTWQMAVKAKEYIRCRSVYAVSNPVRK